MRLIMRGRLFAALLLSAASTFPASAAVLTVTEAGSGKLLASFPVQAEGTWCILWNHSVQGFEVSDCYQNRQGRMVLVRSHLPDFAAGLDHIPGRGRQLSDGMGGYWIEDIDEAVPGNAYLLRPGRYATVNHRLQVAGHTFSISRVAEHGRVRISLEPEPGK
jgi:hypothetical protein